MSTHREQNIVSLRTFSKDVARVRASRPHTDLPQKEPKETNQQEPKTFQSTKQKEEFLAPVKDGESFLEQETKEEAEKPATETSEWDEILKNATSQSQTDSRAITPQPERLIENKQIDHAVNLVSKNVYAESILTDDDGIQDMSIGNDIATGTIIKDKKIKKLGFTRAVIFSIRNWWRARKRAQEIKEASRPKVAPVETRKEVIKAAAEQSVIAPRTDFLEVAKKRKETERTPVVHAVELIDKSEKEPPKWTHIIEDTSEQTPETTPTNESAGANAAPQMKEIEEPKEITPTAETEMRTTMGSELQKELEKIEVPEPSSRWEETHVTHTPATAPRTVETAPEKKETYVPPELPKVIPDMIPVNRREVETPITPVINEQKEQKPPALRYRPSPEREPSFFSKLFSARGILFVTVVLAASTLGVLASMYYLLPQSGSQVEILNPPTSIEAPALIGLPLPREAHALLSQLRESTTAASTRTEFYFTVKDEDGNDRLANTTEIVTVLSNRLPAQLARSVTHIAFGSTGNGEPFVILKTTSFDSAFAGMLIWEESITTDLDPLFVRKASGEAFLDSIINNRSTRLGRTASGEDAVVYSFIDRDTILISTTQSAISDLILRVR